MKNELKKIRVDIKKISSPADFKVQLQNAQEDVDRCDQNLDQNSNKKKHIVNLIKGIQTRIRIRN